MTDPHIIQSYSAGDGSGAAFQIGRDRDGNVILQLMGPQRGLITIDGGGSIPGDIAALSMPPDAWRKFIAACKKEPDLWPSKKS